MDVRRCPGAQTLCQEMMNQLPAREIGIDAGLIVAGVGAGVSMLSLCTGVSGQDPLSLLAPVVVGIAINAVVCLFLVRLITASPILAAFGGAIITELVYLNLATYSVARATRVDPCVAMLPFIIVLTTTPMAILGSIGFARLGVALWKDGEQRGTR